MSQRKYLHKNLELKALQQNNSQSEIYLAKDLKSNESVYNYFLKVYLEKELESFKLERQILKQLQKKSFEGFPKLISSKYNKIQGELQLELEGNNLIQIQKRYKKISEISTIKIIIQLLQRLKDTHSLGIVHNDLKLQNILVGKNNPETIILIDFGISQLYLDKQNQHIKKEFTGKFTGNIIFASLNSLYGITKSRRDDIESLLYIMLYLLNNDLPWSKETLDLDCQGIINFRKNKNLYKDLVEQNPKIFKNLIKYIYSMKSEDKPNYDFIQKQLYKFLDYYSEQNKININDHRFEWQSEQKQLKQEGEFNGQKLNESKFDSYNNVSQRNQFQFKSKIVIQACESINLNSKLQDLNSEFLQSKQESNVQYSNLLNIQNSQKQIKIKKKTQKIEYNDIIQKGTANSSYQFKQFKKSYFQKSNDSIEEENESQEIKQNIVNENQFVNISNSFNLDMQKEQLTCLQFFQNQNFIENKISDIFKQINEIQENIIRNKSQLEEKYNNLLTQNENDKSNKEFISIYKVIEDNNQFYDIDENLDQNQLKVTKMKFHQNYLKQNRHQKLNE